MGRGRRGVRAEGPGQYPGHHSPSHRGSATPTSLPPSLEDPPLQYRGTLESVSGLGPLTGRPGRGNAAPSFGGGGLTCWGAQGLHSELSCGEQALRACELGSFLLTFRNPTQPWPPHGRLIPNVREEMRVAAMFPGRPIKALQICRREAGWGSLCPSSEHQLSPSS